MKTLKLLFLLIILCSAFQLNAQAPQKFSYQAVIRNQVNALVVNRQVGLRFTIIQGSATGFSVFSETHTTMTNQNGMVSVEIGGGTPLFNSIGNINWAQGPYYLKTETDPNGGSSYTISGTTQMLSVPYALYAENSGNPGNPGFNSMIKTDPVFPGTGTCRFGGFKISFGLDLNRNNILDGNEIDNTLTRFVCNAKDGRGIASTTDNGNGTFTFTYTDGTVFTTSNLTGPQGLAGVGISSTVDNGNGSFTLNYTNGTSFTTANLTGPQGAQGAQGVGIVSTVNNGNGTFTFNYSNGSSFTTSNLTGPQGPIGQTGATGATGATGPQGPIGQTGANGPQGPAGTNGTNGTNGQNTIVKTTTETAGANCTTGGVKLEYGLDANNNGILDLSEINAGLTKFVCNGATGSQGIQGIQGPVGATGPQGPAGAIGATGLQGPIGQTGATGATGATGPQGPAGTNGANGTNGTNGQNTIVRTTTETAGANCTTGGVKLEYGLDANNNGMLDLSEINAGLTKFVCNGATGSQGIQGIQGPIGATGPQGIQGPIGQTGATGATGVTGPQGPIGLTGLQGIQGPIGQTGATGPIGPIGPQGLAGANGTDGVSITNSYVQSDSLYVVLSNGQTLNTGYVRGPQGASGLNIIGNQNGQMLYWFNNQWNIVNIGSQGQYLTMCDSIPKWTTNGQCPGIIRTLDCNNVSTSGSIIYGISQITVSATLNYGGGNGGIHNGQVVSSTGITGLTATLLPGNFLVGSGSLNYTITGTPSGIGNATFLINIGNISCTLTLPVTLAVGSNYGGGIVAYIYQPGDLGYVNGELHGIIASTSDNGTRPWGCYGTTIGGTSSVIGSGLNNSNRISNVCTSSAATFCLGLSINGYSDWYLPSSLELQRLYNNRGLIGGFQTATIASSGYWSSTEGDATLSRIVTFLNGTSAWVRKDLFHNIRPVRSF